MAEVKYIESTAIVTVERSQNSDLVRMEIADARRKLDASVEALKEDVHQLNVVGFVRRSIRKHPFVWLGSSVAVGVLLGGLYEGLRYKERK